MSELKHEYTLIKLAVVCAVIIFDVTLGIVENLLILLALSLLQFKGIVTSLIQLLGLATLTAIELLIVGTYMCIMSVSRPAMEKVHKEETSSLIKPVAEAVATFVDDAAVIRPATTNDPTHIETEGSVPLHRRGVHDILQQHFLRKNITGINKLR